MNQHTESGPAVGPSLVDIYINQIGVNEPDNRLAINVLGHYDPVRASLLIGEACRLIANGYEKHVDSRLDEACTLMQIWYRRTDPQARMLRSVAGHLIATAEMIGDRGNPEAASIHQQETRKQATTESLEANLLLYGRKLDAETACDLVGERSQANILNLLIRSDNPDMLVMPSLLQHDRATDDGSGNYDVLLVKRDPTTGEPVIRKVQIKRGCLKYCINSDQGGDLALRNKYDNTIVLLSEDCDAINVSQNDPQNAAQLSRMLGAELQEEQKRTNDVRNLDQISEGLVNVTQNPDPRRFGRKKPMQQQAYDVRRRGVHLLPDNELGRTA